MLYFLNMLRSCENLNVNMAPDSRYQQKYDEGKLELLGHMDAALFDERRYSSHGDAQWWEHNAMVLFCYSGHGEPCSGAWDHEKKMLCYGHFCFFLL